MGRGSGVQAHADDQILAALGRPSTAVSDADESLLSDIRDQLTRWEHNAALEGLHDLAPRPVRSRWAAQREEILDRCPWATQLSSVDGWERRGRRVKPGAHEITVRGPDGADEIIYDVSDTEPLTTAAPRRDLDSERCVSQLTAVAQELGLPIFRGGITSRRPADRAMQRVVNGLLLENPDRLGFLAEAGYEADGHRHRRQFIATHRELAADDEARTIALHLARFVTSSATPTGDAEVEATVLAEALCCQHGVDPSGEFVQRLVLITGAQEAHDIIERRRAAIIGHLGRLRRLISRVTRD